MIETPFHNPGEHAPGEVNTYAWEKAAMAKRVIQARRVANAADSRAHDLTLPEEARAAAEVQAQTQYDRAALTEHTMQEMIPRPMSADAILQRIRQMPKVGTKEFYRDHHLQPPEPYMISYSTGTAPEGRLGVQSLTWGVDCDDWIDTYDIRNCPRFGTHAGDPMTAEHVYALRHAERPVRWDEDGNPDRWDRAFDDREMPEVERFAVTGSAEVDLTEATPEEREAAKQYAATGYISAGVGDPGIPATEHVILPDPPKEV